MATYAVTDTQLSAIADAIRLKTDNPAQMSVDDMPLQIRLIESGGGGAEVLTASGYWIAESLSYRQLIVDHNLNLLDPYAYHYIVRFYADDPDHTWLANNLTVGGNAELIPTTERESAGFKQYNSSARNYDKGKMNGVLKAWYSGSNAAGTQVYTIAETLTNNNGFYVQPNRLTLGLGLRSCEVGLRYNWELIAIKL